MPNKIEGYKSSQSLLSSAAKGAKAGAVERTGSHLRPTENAEAGAADQVTLTQSARDLQQVATAVANAPVVDSNRVEMAKRAIDNGTYQVNAGKIADKILQFEKLLK
ncbi:MAG: flagellar biosynthesis anti-sigma factor FlgM [Proteobacteria bacterium]|nr:flagellar biosynthesis anti-sigma factor FlgM [Pseudomonadota bacterium]